MTGEQYKLKAEDFIPIVGIIRYSIRNKSIGLPSEYLNLDEDVTLTDLKTAESEADAGFKRVLARSFGLALYNIAIVVPLYVGVAKSLEKLLS